MARWRWVWWLVMGTQTLTACRHAEPMETTPASPVAADPHQPGEAEAQAFIAHLARGEYALAYASMDPTMSAALPPDKLEEMWKGLVAQLGELQGLDRVTSEPAGAYLAVKAQARFSKTPVTLQIGVSSKGQISGFFVQPAASAEPWSAPSYADASRFSEREVKVGVGPALPGHLTMPSGKGPFPAVILVHGSGPGDEDESVGANKPFRDLAQGLASRGIAVLRYAKRTAIAPQGVRTVEEEYFEGLRAAVALLAQTPAIDPHRIAAVGLSEGAYLMPWILRDTPGLAGGVLMAACARPILDLAVEQLQVMAAREPSNQAVAAKLAQVKEARDKANSPDLKPTDRIMGGTGSYFLALRGYDPAAVASRIPKPMLLLQGGRDYQVSPERDFAPLCAAVKALPNARCRLYPTLNHLFIAGTGESTPAEYRVPGHVDAQVIEDLATWVQGLPTSTGP